MSDAYLGEIKMFAGNFAPVGFAMCNGQLLSINENDALFSLLGTTYGGDGATTFGLPDLRGRTPLHAGQGQGLSQRILGQVLGTETVSLTASQIPPHAHAVHCRDEAGTATDPTGNTWAGSSTTENQYSTNAPNVFMSGNAITLAGEGQPHENMAPFQVVNFIIATEGIFPPHS